MYYITNDMIYVINNVKFTTYGMFRTSSLSYTNNRRSNSIVNNHDKLCYHYIEYFSNTRFYSGILCLYCNPHYANSETVHNIHRE